MAMNQTVRRLLVGNELKRTREARGLTQEKAGERIGSKPDHISRLELGQTRVRVAEVENLLKFYGDDEQHIEAITSIARGANSRGRWNGHRATFPEWFRMYVDLEGAAERIQQVQSEIIPGILQVEPYIRTIHAEWARSSDYGDRTVDDSVTARKERQEIFTRADRPSVSFVLSESCLRREVGGPEVMLAQLDYLVKVSRQRNVQLQILPSSTKTFTGSVSYPFTMLTIGAPGIASPLEFVYVENYDEARYLDDKDAVRAYGELWSRLTAAALGRRESQDFIRTVAEQYRQL
jgi:transcriptional regulator with XRE-family HTH domain